MAATTTTKRPKATKTGKAGKRAHAAAAKTGKKPKAAKLSALDAAAKVLAEAGESLNCKSMIDAMAAKGYWQSPDGKTPASTLYSAILRELKTKGSDARFRKTERGKFGLKRK